VVDDLSIEVGTIDLILFERDMLQFLDYDVR